MAASLDLAYGQAGLYSLGHGGNDAQKTIGIIWLLLIAAGHVGASDSMPPVWVIWSCYLAIGLAQHPGEARQVPFDLKQRRLNGPMGTHFLDMQFTQGDLIDLVARKSAPLPRLPVASGSHRLKPSGSTAPRRSPRRPSSRERWGST